MSATASRIPDMTDSSISLEDESFFQEAIALAEQTLKLSSGGALLCPATRRTAKCMLESAKLGMSPTSKKHRFFTTEIIHSNVYYDKKSLQQCFIDEAKYHDLITELCHIFREHYVLKYTDCHVDDLPAALHKLCSARSDSHCLDYIRTRTNPTWDELVRGMKEERVLMSNYESALWEHERELKRDESERKRERELERKRDETPSSWRFTYVNLNVPAVEPGE